MPIIHNSFQHEPSSLASAVIILRLEGSGAVHNGGWKSSKEIREIRAKTGAIVGQLPGDLGMATEMHARATALLPKLAAGLDEHGLDVPALEACLKKFPAWDASDLEILQSARLVIDDWARKAKARVNVTYELAKGLKSRKVHIELSDDNPPDLPENITALITALHNLGGRATAHDLKTKSKIKEPSRIFSDAGRWRTWLEARVQRPRRGLFVLVEPRK